MSEQYTSLGLMSGTSGDGVDALLVDVSQHRFAGCEVGVQAGDHCVGHGYLLD